MRFAFFVISLLMAVCSFAQVHLQGIVYKYNGEKRKTPLARVSVIVSGAVSSESSANGIFPIDASSLSPGQEVQVSATKPGYEVFNKDAMENYRLARGSKDMLTVVMVESRMFRALCQKYYSASSASYAKQLKKELDQWTARRRESKIDEKEYNRKVAELNADYESKRHDIAVYAEQFARIDLSDVSDRERNIIRLVQEGRLDEAIAEYEELNPGAMYVALSRELSKISEDLLKVDELLKCKTDYAGRIYYNLNRQIDLYVEEGGEENYRKAEELMKRAVLADTTNFELVEKYARFKETNGDYPEALKYYNIALPLLKGHEDACIYLQARIEDLEEKMKGSPLQ